MKYFDKGAPRRLCFLFQLFNRVSISKTKSVFQRQLIVARVFLYILKNILIHPGCQGLQIQSKIYSLILVPEVSI